MGRPKLKIEDWFSNSERQLAWARGYLEGRDDRAVTSQQWDYNSIVALLHRWQQDASGRERLTRMRNAWNQANSKAKRNKQVYSYTLSREAAKRLLKIAEEAGIDRSAAIEGLINQDAESRARAREERKKAISDKLAELERQSGRGISPTQLKDLKWAEKYKAANDILEEQVATLLQENCEQWALLLDLGQDNKRLTKDQQDRALLRYQEREQVLAGSVGKASRRARKVPVDTTIGGGASPAIFTEDGELTEKQTTQGPAEAPAIEANGGQEHQPSDSDGSSR